LSSNTVPNERVEAFWSWFSASEDRLYDFESDQERVFNELIEKLKGVEQNLTFEFGPDIDGVREYVISAGGIRDSFHAVEALADGAPSLPRWKITKYRPRRPELGNLKIGDQMIDPNDIDFALEKDGKRVGISLFIDGYSEANTQLWGQVGFLFLDVALGEYDVETKVGHIEFKPYAFKTRLDRRPLPDLPGRFDAFVADMNDGS
jgi:hypothetical protein